ncbi:L-asparaginase [Lentzea sp. NBRC 105346]|uniref:asparaginase n=1 Tax=Lentzea sp. NBRC 105346 TaxID=3032205 RepID=UPI0024A4FB95|nr:asparaginase [Lentzea sp. NBRC 105346]GLZ30942.1 L-asparaginase [Lentzea sp. NBRC 105346]
MPLTGRHVAVFALGGTIATTVDPLTSKLAPALSAEQLLQAVPGLNTLGVRLRVHDFRRLPSASLSIADIEELRAAIVGSGPVDGVVVVQGTDTMEETSFYLDLLYEGEAPIVFTGAMRNATMAGPDGPANLHAAVIAAAGPWLRGAGCVVVAGDEVHAARTVHKSHTTRPAAFTSPGSGPLGLMVEGQVRLHQQLPRRTVGPAEIGTEPVRVALHTVCLGDDGTQLDLLEGRYDGLVVAALGAGHVPEWQVPRLRRLAAQIPVVLASRIGDGPVLTNTYSYPGSERDLLAHGLIAGGSLSPYKARLLLHRLLATGCRDQARIAEAFSAY